jgi:hypothetical protein
MCTSCTSESAPVRNSRPNSAHRSIKVTAGANARSAKPGRNQRHLAIMAQELVGSRRSTADSLRGQTGCPHPGLISPCNDGQRKRHR